MNIGVNILLTLEYRENLGCVIDNQLIFYLHRKEDRHHFFYNNDGRLYLTAASQRCFPGYPSVLILTSRFRVSPCFREGMEREKKCREKARKTFFISILFCICSIHYSVASWKSSRSLSGCRVSKTVQGLCIPFKSVNRVAEGDKLTVDVLFD